MKAGFIGLGIMGKPMAKNLLKAGYDLFVYNRSRPAVDELVKCGAADASLKEIGERCQAVMTMLPDGPDVEQVVLGEKGLASYMKKGTVLIDMSSINPLISQKIAAYLEERGIDMLDAPVSGGQPKAIDGTLAFMVGGKQEIFAKYKDVLSAMGSSAVYCGQSGAGNTVKLANQIIVAANIQALAEGLTFARKAGVDPETLVQAIKGGLAGSAVLEAKAPMMIAGNDEPGFKIDLHIKDLNNALALAEKVGAPILMSDKTLSIMTLLSKNGAGQKDHSALAQYYESLAGVKIGG